MNNYFTVMNNYNLTTLTLTEQQETINPENIIVDPQCYESHVFEKFQHTVFVLNNYKKRIKIDDILLAASTASTVFNFLVIFCAFKLFKRSGDTMHLFIINMTLGDLLLTGRLFNKNLI